ncbi:unnamed protein product [Moneuplotes crassus]|uniref:Uncharacterized protein n=1 Tax=Euplotes crassus TaxID=5936 RepID=A0AAD2D2I9_EUPCR|nr:unnamed protein product [Moneuplotes crassus]
MEHYLSKFKSVDQYWAREIMILREEQRLNESLLKKLPSDTIRTVYDGTRSTKPSFCVSTEPKYMKSMKKLRLFREEIESLDIVSLSEQSSWKFSKFLKESKFGSISNLKICCKELVKGQSSLLLSPSKILKRMASLVTCTLTLEDSELSVKAMEKLMASISSVKHLNFVNCKIDVNGALMPARVNLNLKSIMFMDCEGPERCNWDAYPYKFQDFLSFISKTSITKKIFTLKIFSKISNLQMRDMLRKTNLSGRVKLEGSYFSKGSYHKYKST